MTRREEIENIIIGTLLGSMTDESFFNSCRCCITPDMFSDDTNRRIYQVIFDMNSGGFVETNPSTIFMRYGYEVSGLVPRMCELAAEFSFVSKMSRYNENQFLLWSIYGIRPNYSKVTFDDYVNRFIQIVFSNEREERDQVRRGGAAAAA